MSKQSEAKAAQGYDAKPVPQTCGNCAHYRCDKALKEYQVGKRSYRTGRIFSVELDGTEKNKRCGIGGFVVMKTATCAKFAPKEQQK